MKKPLRVLIADDQPRVRLGLNLLLERQVDLTVQGEAAYAMELLDLVVSQCPDLLLLDWGLPGMMNASLLAHLDLICPQLDVVVLSGLPEVESAARAAGAAAFICKADPPEKLLETLTSVLTHHVDLQPI